MKPRRAHLLLAFAIVALGGGVRLCAMQAGFPHRPVGDEVYYVRVADHIAAGGGHGRNGVPIALRPPLHPYLLSGLVDREHSPVARGPRGATAIVPERLRPLLALQVGLGTLLVALAIALARGLFDMRTALVAGAVSALYPTLVAFSHYLWSETLFAVLVSGGLAGVVWSERRQSLALAGLSGVAFGAAALTREIAVPVAAVCALWWVCNALPGRRRAAVARGALMALCAALVVLPWTVRNYRVFGQLVPVATVGWWAAAEGNTFETSGWRQFGGPARREFIRRYSAAGDEIASMEFARRYTLEQVRTEQPSWVFKKLVRNLPRLFSPDSYLFEKIRRGAYGDLPLAGVRGAVVLTAAIYTLVVVAGVLGVASASGGGRRLLPCLVFAVVAAFHVAANARTRYRLPYMPLLIVYASYAALRWRTLSARLAGRKWIAPALILLFFLAVCVPHFVETTIPLWLRGSSAGVYRP